MSKNESPVVKAMILSGQENYSKWSQQFKIKAIGKQLWTFYSGEETVIIKPDYKEYVPDNLTGITLIQFQSRVEQYNLALAQYKEYMTKKVKAAELLLDAVDDHIAEKVLAKIDDPAAAWNYLRAQYEMDERKMVNNTIASWDRVAFDNKEGMETYLRQHKEVYDKLKDAGVEIGGVFAMGKIIQGLPKRFYPWINRYYEDRKSETYDDTLNNLITQLTIEDGKLDARWQEERAGKPETRKKLGEDKNDNDNSELCAQCRKPGHTKPNCWWNKDNPNNKLLKRDGTSDNNSDNNSNSEPCEQCRKLGHAKPNCWWNKNNPNNILKKEPYQ